MPKDQEMVVTNNGKPVALLTTLNDTDLEGTLRAVRRARALQALAALLQKYGFYAIVNVLIAGNAIEGSHEAVDGALLHEW